MNLPDPLPQPPLSADPRESLAPTDGQAPPAYEPPCLIAVGNLRDLLGKTGARQDFGPGPRRS